MRTTRSQFLVVLTYILVVQDARTVEFCYLAYMIDNLLWRHPSRVCDGE